jgi:hypothetical protein
MMRLNWKAADRIINEPPVYAVSDNPSVTDIVRQYAMPVRAILALFTRSEFSPRPRS